MDKREQLMAELSKALERLEQQESALANRAAALLSVTTLAVTLVLALRQRDLALPLAVIVLYILLAIASAFSIGGRELVDPRVDLDVRRQWADMPDAEVNEILFDAKRMALRANAERVAFVRIAFRIHLAFAAATLVASLLLLGSF